MFEYSGRVLRVVDGDTLVLDIDLGLCTWVRQLKVRLAGVNAPELPTPEGLAAREFVERLVADRGPDVVVRTLKDRREKYGRWLADITWPPEQTGLAALLVEAGHAHPM